jgi:hypothetical protein
VSRIRISFVGRGALSGGVGIWSSGGWECRRGPGVVGEESRESIRNFGFRNKRVSLFTPQGVATMSGIEVYPARSGRFKLALFAMLSGTINPIPPSIYRLNAKSFFTESEQNPFLLTTRSTRRLSCSCHILQVGFPRAISDEDPVLSGMTRIVISSCAVP